MQNKTNVKNVWELGIKMQPEYMREGRGMIVKFVNISKWHTKELERYQFLAQASLPNQQFGHTIGHVNTK